MEEIQDIKCSLKSTNVLSIISECLYEQTKEKINLLAENYYNDPNIETYGYYLEDKIYGVIVIEKKNTENLNILNLAVSKDHQRQGIGSKLIDYIISELAPKTLTAETDDDAVDFYRKHNFSVTSLGEKYNNVTRYKCEYKW